MDVLFAVVCVVALLPVVGLMVAVFILDVVSALAGYSVPGG
jgi:hypothetical protein